MSAATRCEPFSAFPLLPRPSTCPAWPSAVSASAGCEPIPAPAATCTRYRRRPARGTSASAWNNAVRTRGVSTHRDDFQKPACAERGLVRTGTAPIISESAVIWTFRAITPATVGRKESPSVSSQQRPICSRLDRTFRRRCRLNSPACCSRQARYYRHFTYRRRLPLAARLTFLGSRDCSGIARPSGGGRQGADRQADNDFACPHIGAGRTFNLLCTTMLSATARVSWLCPCRGGSICLLSGQRRVSPDSTESGELLRHNIRLTRDCNWNCAGYGKVGKRLERRRGSGTRPVSIVTGVEMARLRSKRRGSGICPV